MKQVLKIKLKNLIPLAKRGKKVGDEDELLSYLMNSNNTVYSPTGGYNVQFAPTTAERDYQAVGLPGAQIVGQSPNPQARYVNQLANQISQQQGVGNNNDYFRTVGILNNIMKDKKYVGKDGALNQQGWAKLAQDQMFGPGSDWYKRHSQSAKDVASGLAQVATLPYFAGMGGLELLGSVGGGALGATIGTNIGQNFDNPYTGNYAGSELGGLVGGTLGGASGANIRGLGQAYIRGMNNLANRQDLYWASRGYKLNGTQPTAAEISKTFPLNTTSRILDYNSSIRSSSMPNKTYLRLAERPSKLTIVERKGIPKGQARVENDPVVFENAKAFAKKYGYEEPTTVEEIKNMYRRHNRFFRVVSPQRVGKYDMEKGIHYGIDTELYPQLSGVTEQELPFLLASKGYPYEQYLNRPELELYPTEVFVSPTLSENAIYTDGDLTNTILLLRPFSFRNPKNWHIDAEYKVPTSGQAVGKGEISWGNSSPIHEFKVSTKHLIPVRRARSSDLGTNMGNIFDYWYGEELAGHYF